jgi:hypothetical protein
VEILFVPKDNALQTQSEVYGRACSIVYSGQVHLEKKRFSRKEWIFRSIDVSDKSYNTMLDFCKLHKGDKFNHFGYFMYWAGMFAPKPTFYPWVFMSHRWYCSEIVIGALKAGNVLDMNYPSAIHPDTLYKFIKTHSMVNCGRNIKDLQLSFA